VRECSRVDSGSKIVVLRSLTTCALWLFLWVVCRALTSSPHFSPGDPSSWDARVADIPRAGVCAHVRAEIIACRGERAPERAAFRRSARSGALGGSWTLGFELTTDVGVGGVATYKSARVAVLALSQTTRAQHSHSCSLPWASAFPPRRLQEYCGVAWAASHSLCARCPPQHGTGHPARCLQLCACVGEMHISFGLMV
jgi:hypothetical protein